MRPNVIILSLVGLFPPFLGGKPANLLPAPVVSWQDAQIFQVPAQPDPVVEQLVEKYLDRISALGIDRDRQGIWLQSDWADLAQHQGTTALSGASLTKIATTLVALETWGAQHRFTTRIYGTGPVEAGQLRGDLVIEASQDPLFVWEEAIALGNLLNQQGITEVTGDLVVVGDFAMNFKTDPEVSARLLAEGMDSNDWSGAVWQQYQTLPEGTPEPKLAIAGQVRTLNQLPADATLLIQHQSLSLLDLLQQMNIYSNNTMAQMLADHLGGAQQVASTAAQVARVPAEEIQLINGSGLGVENRLSPRAVSHLLITLEQRLYDQPIGVADLFPVAGRDDQKGTLTVQGRRIPSGIALKTGTLNQVSALAGMIPTKERGPVWFAIINSGYQIPQFRRQQDALLASLADHWQVTPAEESATQSSQVYIGDPQRNQWVLEEASVPQ